MEFSHIDKDGRAKMVDVGAKEPTDRQATAEGKIYLAPATLKAVKDGAIEKGNVLNTAKVAAIMAAKNTSGIIPMCHNLPLDGVDVDFSFGENYIKITATARTFSKTGVEMEALTAVSAAALTVYDMVKAADKFMEIDGIKLLKKSGGKSGDFFRGERSDKDEL